MSMFSYISCIFVIFICIFFSVFVYIKNSKSPLNRAFFLYVLTMSGWIITLILFYNSSQENVLFIGKLNFVFVELMVYSGFYLGYWFPEKVFKFNFWTHFLLFLWLIFLIIITLKTDLIDKNEIITPDGIETVFGDFFIFFILHFLFLFSPIFIFPLYKYNKVVQRQKLQIKYFTIGILLTIIFGSITNIILPYLFKYYDLQDFGPLGLLFFFSFTAYAIIKHNLLDIYIVIQRGLIYSSLLVIIIGFYIFLIFILGFLFHQTTDTTIMLAAGITTIIGIFGASPIEKKFRKITDKIFFKDKYDYSEAVYQLSEVLNRNIKLEDLLRGSVNKLREILKVKKASIILSKQNLVFENNRLSIFSDQFPVYLIKFFKEDIPPILVHAEILDLLKEKKFTKEQKQILKKILAYSHKNKTAVSVSILLKKKLIGLIVLEEKLSGDLFSSEDFNLLKTFSYQAAVAIEKAQLYEEVRGYSENLEKKVKKRTAKIEGLQKEQKQMMLEIAHGLQTPLTIIKSELNALEQEIKDNKKIQSLDKTIDRASALIYNMLKLAKMETERDSRKKKIDLSALLRDLAEEFKIITQDRNIKIISNIKPIIFINGDQGRLEELITNLVSNSVKYMREDGDRKIIISLDKKNHEAELIIEDTGIGIAQEHLKNLFSRFYRIKDSSHFTKMGTGLGLAICKKIIEMHGGCISVSSKVGQGTKFSILLPTA